MKKKVLQIPTKSSDSMDDHHIVSNPIAGLRVRMLPRPAISAETKAMRETLLGFQAIDETDSSLLAGLPAAIRTDEFEDILEDYGDITKTSEEIASKPLPVYPPVTKFNSSIQMLSPRPTESSESDWKAFLDVLQGAYSGHPSGATGAAGAAGKDTGSKWSVDNILRVTLISTDMKSVYSMEFDEEKDYWKLVSGIRRVVTQMPRSQARSPDSQILDTCSGVCKYTTTCKVEVKKGIFGRDPTPSYDRFEIRDQQLLINGSLNGTLNGSIASPSQRSVTIDLNDMHVMALSKDYENPQKALVVLDIALPDTARRYATSANLGMRLRHTCCEDHTLLYRASASAAAVNLSTMDEVCLVMPTNEMDVFSESPWKLDLINSAECNKIIGSFTLLKSAFIHIPGSTLTKEESRPRASLSPQKSTVRMPFASTPPPAQSPKSMRHSRAPSAVSIGGGVLRARAPLVVDVSLTQKQFDKALRLMITQADGLPLTSGRVPSAYCTVYLLGEDGQRLTCNHAEVRTDTVKAVDPVWNKELLLQDSKLGVQEVSSVMVLVRDASVGILKHHHIGQVTIPIHCFLEDTEANLCLPLEPSYRMDGQVAETSFIGDMHVITQLVNVVAKEEDEPKKNMIQAKGRRLSIYNSEGQHAKVTATLHKALPMATWWPVRVMMSPPRASLAAEDALSLGFVLLCPLVLKIRCTSLAFPAISQCKEAEAGMISIPWNKVRFTAVTPSAVHMELEVSMAIEQRFSPTMLALLIAPCPAEKLIEYMASRCKLSPVRTHLEELATMKYLNMAGKGVKRALSFRSRASSAPEILKLTANQVLDIANRARVIGNLLEGLMDPQQVQEDGAAALLTESQLLLSLDSPAPKESRAYEDGMVRVLFYYLRSVLLPRLLQHAEAAVLAALATVDGQALSGELLPDYTPEGVQRLLECDTDDTQLLTPLREHARVECLGERFLAFIEALRQRVRDLVLFVCLIRGTNSSGSGMLTGSLTKSIEDMMTAYHSQLRRALVPYIESKNIFRNLPGQALKNTILRLLIDHNAALEEAIRPCLGMLDMSLPRGMLQLTDQLEAVLDWYTSALLFETKQWFSKTLQQALTNRTNRHDLPWDVDMVGGCYVSFLPETLAYQLNVFKEICSVKHVVVSVKLSEAIAQALGLLGDEYGRVLRMKHWDQPHDALEIIAYRSFLVSIVNDCYRLSNMEIVQSTAPSAPAAAAAGPFQQTMEMAIRCLCQMIFADITMTLVEFDWFNSCNTITRTFVQHLSSSLRNLAVGMQSAALAQVVLACSEVISLRYLIMLRDKLASHTAFTFDEAIRLKVEVGELKEAFAAMLPTPPTQPVAQPFAQSVLVEDMFIHLHQFSLLLAEDYDTSIFLGTVMWIVRNYDTDFAEMLLLSCVLPLRYQAGPEVYSYLVSVLETDHRRMSIAKGKGRDLLAMVFARDSISAPQAAAAPSKKSALRSLNPTTAIKHLRERASDLVSKGLVPMSNNKKANEEYAMNLMRALGLDSTPEDVEVVVEEEVISSLKRPSLGGKAMSIMANAAGMSTPSVKSMPEILGVVLIRAVEVRNIHSSALLGAANPYISFTIAGERIKTSVQWNKLAAAWTGETFTLLIDPKVLQTEKLLVEVFDKERIRRKRLIGSVTVKLAGLEMRNMDGWYALVGGEHSGAGSEVHFSMSYAAPNSDRVNL